ncbi:MAG: GH1 family beta-glucosidase [Sphingomonadales bacterium]
MTTRVEFPSSFLWGASTSAYQIEGAAHEDGRGASIWDTRCLIPGKVADGRSGDVACDHYHRYAEDIGLMKELGLGAYRFSVAWPRVLPAGRGAINEKGLDFYDRLIDGVLSAGIEPWLCLYHWDLPQALHDLGGWTSRDSAHWFADYAALIAGRYGDRVKRWATFNEFNVFTMFGYAIDWAAPGITDKAAHLQAIHHVNLAHGDGAAVLRGMVGDASIGAIHNVQPVIPEDDAPWTAEAAALLDEHWNLAFADPQCLGRYPPRTAAAIEPYVHEGDMARIRQMLDWFGVNHYGPIFAKADPSTTWGYGWGSARDDVPSVDIGWTIHPDAFRQTLLGVSSRYGLPVYVTESGCGDPTNAVDDTGRVLFLAEYVKSMRQAMDQGADVRGYFVWSLLDAFEWGSGYTTRFGIIHVDFATLQRTLKTSAGWYRDLARSGMLAV